MTLRTALCISSCSMSSVTFSAAVSLHFASRSRRCSLESSPASSSPSSAADPASASFRCEYSQTCVRKRLARVTAESLQFSDRCGLAA